jgi:signal transduction histidine kinase
LEQSHRWGQELECRVRERTRELEAARHAQAELLRKVISAQEEERRRIARDLHDDTSQALASLAMSLDLAAASPQGLPAQLSAMKELVVNTLDRVHQMIFDLRPSVLDDLGLLAALHWYAESRLEPLGVKVRLDTAGTERRLPSQVETVVFRVAQEAITNIARHAGAESVMMGVEFAHGSISMEIEDDGQGFEPAALQRTPHDTRGLGLLGMQERVALAGGTFSIWSEPGSGTRIFFRVPLPPEVERGGQD